MSTQVNTLASNLWEIRETVSSGRGVFARCSIPANTLLLETSDIAAHVIHQEYRKEVCAQCFAYDRGRNWKIRDNAIGCAFCSLDCEQTWRKSHVGEILLALQAIETFCKAVKPQKAECEIPKEIQPSQGLVTESWADAERTADLIRRARAIDKPTKAQRSALSNARTLTPDRNELSFLLNGALCAVENSRLWHEVLALEHTEQPFASIEAMNRAITAYQHLMVVLPISFTNSITASKIQHIIGRSAHNAFNIWAFDDDRDQGDSGGECLGYGLWPSASYWNHSCVPNIRKKRDANTWRFWTNRAIEPGEELCITYLGGDEKHLDIDQRRDRLRKYWGFQCHCVKCIDESRSSLHC